MYIILAEPNKTLKKMNVNQNGSGPGTASGQRSKSVQQSGPGLATISVLTPISGRVPVSVLAPVS